MPLALRRPFQGTAGLDPVSRGTWGPIFGDPGIPPLFGPIFTPRVPIRERPERGPRFGPISGGAMPSLRDQLIAGAFGLGRTAIAGIFGGRETAGRFMPGQVPDTPVPWPPIFGPSRPAITVTPGRVINQGCDCIVQKQMPAYIRRMKGRAVFGADGQVIGCSPARKRMNPMNGRAATRAARRLTSVMRFQKKIQKAVRRACGSKSGGFRRVSSTKRGSCK